MLTVGIGASAGGIQALKRFFERVPADTGAAYIVVLHLPADHESRLAEVLQTSAAIPVIQVRDRVRVEPNHVYVVPPDRTLAVHEGSLTATRMTRVEERRAPVDSFFGTLAEAQRERAACVILSGTGANGAMGLKRVKEHGGMCLVQDPDEAEHADMPRHAIATGLTDAVLPVAEMPARIIAYCQALERGVVPGTFELQSVNEELRTVNQELVTRLEAQAQAAADLQNLIFSTDIATIFLDRESRITLFTPRARDLFPLLPADRGRPLPDVSSSLVDVDLHRDMAGVLERLEQVEREVATREGRWYLMRMLPYRAADERIDGIVITFVDITTRKDAEGELRRSEERLRLLVDSVADYAIFSIDVRGHIDSWNSGAARVFGYTHAEAIGQPAGILFTPEDRDAGVPQAELRKALEQGSAPDERWHVRRDGSRSWLSGAVTPVRDAGGQVIGFVKIAHDLTPRKRLEDTLDAARREIEMRKQERTRELENVNQALDAELRERERVEERIRGLLHRLITVQEDERRRIARDLHDQIGQELAALSIRLDGLVHALGDPDTLGARVDELRQIVSRLDEDVDFFAWELRPATLDDVGLVASLGAFVREWSRRFAIAAEFHGHGLEGVRLSREIETNLYRITQEALNNVHKHAHASRASILLERRNGDAVLVIEDDGVGFDADGLAVPPGREHGLGLTGMGERAAVIGATLEIESQPGRGTTVYVRVPLPAGDGVRAEV